MATPDDDIEAWLRALGARGSGPETREIELLRTLVNSRKGALPEFEGPLADATDAGWDSLRARWLAMEIAAGRAASDVALERASAGPGVRWRRSALAASLALIAVGWFAWRGLTVEKPGRGTVMEVAMRGSGEAQIIQAPSIAAAAARAAEVEAACRHGGIAVRVVPMRDRTRLEAMMPPQVLKARPELAARLRAAGVAIPGEDGRLIVEWVAP